MAANDWAVYGPANEAINDGTIDLDDDSFRMVLVTSSYTPDQTADDTWSDISTNEVANGNGYATHGKAITQSTSRTNLVYTFDCDDQTWTSSTITAAYAVIVRDADDNGALAAGDLVLAYCELEDGGTVSTTSADLAVTISTSGVFSVTAATAA